MPRCPTLAPRTGRSSSSACNLDLAVSHLLLDTGAGAKVEVGVQALNVVMLHAVVLVAQAIVEGQPRSQPKAVLGIKRPVLEAVAARIGGRTSAAESRRRLCSLPDCRIYRRARERTLRIDPG